MAIDTDKIVHAVMHGSRIREEKGITPLFGVYLSMIPVQYYNRISFGFEKKMGNDGNAEKLLVAAGQECGYATFQGIRSSMEWDEVVRPKKTRIVSLLHEKHPDSPCLQHRNPSTGSNR